MTNDEPAEISFEQSPEKGAIGGSAIVQNILNEHEKFKEKYMDFYFNQWRSDEKPCPAFGGEIVKITKSGWDHINKDNRDIAEAKKRLELLPLAKILLEKSNFYQWVVVSDDGTFLFYEIKGIVKGRHVQIVVKQQKGMPKIFYSVFDYKERPMALNRYKTWNE